jgi:ribosome-binding ATPase YchF (GTP1/OBG family)
MSQVLSGVKDILDRIVELENENKLLKNNQIIEYNKNEQVLKNIITDHINKINKLEKDNNELVNKITNLELEIKELADDDLPFLPIDPRVDNKSLPNDAIINYTYGARGYITSTYPGYIWRNCNWYKITKTLKFKKVCGNSSTHTSKFINTTGIDYTLCINDSYDELLIDDTRTFGLPTSRDKNGLAYSYNMYYVPMLKGMVSQIPENVSVVNKGE